MWSPERELPNFRADCIRSSWSKVINRINAGQCQSSHMCDINGKCTLNIQVQANHTQFLYRDLANNFLTC